MLKTCILFNPRCFCWHKSFNRRQLRLVGDLRRKDCVAQGYKLAGTPQEFSCSPSFEFDDLQLLRDTDLICNFDRITLELPEDYFVIRNLGVIAKSPELAGTFASL